MQNFFFRFQFIHVVILKIGIKSINVYHHVSVNQTQIDEAEFIASINTEHQPNTCVLRIIITMNIGSVRSIQHFNKSYVKTQA